jgi:arylsulfatase A-like enzyme/Flp pilus assembly protein TadD
LTQTGGIRSARVPPRPLGMRCAILVFLAWSASAAAAAATPALHNLVLVTLDTTRADHLGCYGRDGGLTPAIDALASRGVVFERAYTSAPLTLPAHSTILTGREPPEHGARLNGRDALAVGVPTLAETLAARGFATGAFVAAFVLDHSFGLDRGFQTYDDDLADAVPQEVPEPLSVYRPGNRVADAALGWLGRRDRGHPFFLWMHLYDAHQPYLAHPEATGLPHAGERSYDAEIAFADRQVGRLVEALAARGLADDTVIVVTGDHGEGLGQHGEMEHGYLLNEEVLHVPMIIVAPGRIPPGVRVRTMVSHRDLVPSVCDLLGVPPPPGLRGRNLAGSDRGDVASAPVYSETDLGLALFGWSPLRSITTERWKYVRTTRPELYDRTADPNELVNLAPDRADTVAQLDGELRAMEAAMTPARGTRVALDGTQQQRLEALGYLLPSDDAPADAHPLHDVKDMLPVKRLHGQLMRRLATDSIEPSEALPAAEELVRRSPESAGFHKTLAVVLIRLDRLDDARRELEEALRRRADFPEVEVALADVAQRQGDGDAAIAHLGRALHLQPDLFPAQVALADALAGRGRLEEAVAAYEAALRMQPDHPQTHYNLANTLARAGRTKEAIAHYEATLRAKPAFPMARFNLGRVLLTEGQGEAAERQFRELTRTMPEFAPAHTQLSRLLATRGDARAALVEARAAASLAPDQPQVVADLAWLLATSADGAVRDAHEARVAAERALRLGRDDDPRLLDVLAAAQAAGGDFDDARQTGQRAVAAARAAGDEKLATAAEERVRSYAARVAFRQGSRAAPD